MRALALLCLMAVTSNLHAAEWQRRLLPIAVIGAPGAFGTVWSTRVTAVQELEDGVEIIGNTTLDVPPGRGGSIPHRVFFLPTANEPPGMIFHVPADVAHAVHLAAHIEQRGVVISDITVLPVVPEEQFVAHTVFFPQLESDEDERMHLRAYSLDLERAAAAIRVRVRATWSTQPWFILHDAVYPLAVSQKTTRSVFDGDDTVFPLRPLAVEVHLDPIIDQVPQGADVAVSVEPAIEGLHIWAMLSETNNLTQRVRLWLPQ